MRKSTYALFYVYIVFSILLCEKLPAVDLGTLQSKLLSLTEAVASADKAGDAERLAVLSCQWRDVSPLISQDLGELFDESVAKISADIKKYRAKSEDGSLPERISQKYDHLATQMQESLKGLMVLKSQAKIMSDKLNEMMKVIAERPDVKSLTDANEAKKKADEALQRTDKALDMLDKLQR
jgi:hypothetical protein